MFWRYEAGIGFVGVCAVCEAADEAHGAEGDGPVGEGVYYRCGGD